MADHEPVDVPLSHLPPEAKAKRSGSFGEVASHYERYRPGPPVAVVDWILPNAVGRIVDLGAGTGALTRLLVDRADEVVAVEPDDRMRSVLTAEVPGIRALAGRGESIPVPDGSVDAVVASSSWHWMDLLPTLHEVARVLVPGGVLGTMWTGPDPEGPFVSQARALLVARSGGDGAGGDGAGGGGGEKAGGRSLAGLIMGDADRPASILEIPPGVPFDQPDHEVVRWDVALNADEVIGLLGTFSSIITLPEETRSGVMSEARRLLGEWLGVEGDVTVDVAFRSEAWRTNRHR
jgi:SAM-dependent methyltransferase